MNSEKITKFTNVLIIAFLIARIVLNIPNALAVLGIFFIGSYLLILFLFLKKSFLFLPVFAVFLAIDSMIGTYFFASGNLGEVEYYGTMIINLFFMVLAIWFERLRVSNINKAE